MTDIRQTSEYAKYMESIGWKVEMIGKMYVFIKKLPIIGSVMKIQRPDEFSNLTIQQLNNLASKHRAFKISVEPLNKNNESSIKTCLPAGRIKGYKPSSSPSLPSKTIQINLAKTEDKLLAEMHSKTRYNIKIAMRNNLTISQSSNISAFAKFWQNNSPAGGKLFSQKKNITNLYKSFGDKAKLIVAKNNDELLGGILLLFSPDTAYYMYAASSKMGKSLHAPTLLVWEAIKLAKNRGVKIFDFEGIYDKRFPLDSWLGFTHFKKSFGGVEIEYPGLFAKYRFPL